MNENSFGRTLATAIVSGVSGLLFGLGLILSQMVDPQRVTDFLDIAGNWNPALAFVMGGAIVVAAPAFAFARRRRNSVLGGAMRLPDRFRISPGLILGAALFGLGWGISGICPGPGLVLFSTLDPHALVFIGALAVGLRFADLAITTSPTRPKEPMAAAGPAD